ncbi:hypothetical protein M231_03751 [Tremella mesenterica]|uniref:C2H2-type domain-containing protein n=1 Tax=Tremella mesenterica TaxID=5217 RepID=A0A4Q1BMG5_TREME|nr:uncharacterized protein TREMEDRAFT_64986 [Tremella mesenterica DSM 1558]EIW67117.1 hypothetical protein TREMEDRAFT_64986 [Tremella mesenterica DSM 1558]RXK39021.1 hypothetical protein M231_03751 [Tremella mesenterica]
MSVPLVTPMNLARYAQPVSHDRCPALSTPPPSHGRTDSPESDHDSRQQPPQTHSHQQAIGAPPLHDSVAYELPFSHTAKPPLGPTVFPREAPAWSSGTRYQPYSQTHQPRYTPTPTPAPAEYAEEERYGYPAQPSQGYFWADHQEGYDYDDVPRSARKVRMSSREAELKAKKHVCPVCDKRFNRPSSLQTHMSVHTGAKPYVCKRQDCGRRFSVSSNLRRHERTHEQRSRTSHDPSHTPHTPHTSLDYTHPNQQPPPQSQPQTQSHTPVPSNPNTYNYHSSPPYHPSYSYPTQGQGYPYYPSGTYYPQTSTSLPPIGSSVSGMYTADMASRGTYDSRPRGVGMGMNLGYGNGGGSSRPGTAPGNIPATPGTPEYVGRQMGMKELVRM